MAVAAHHVDAIIRNVYDQGYFGYVADRIIDVAIELSGRRGYNGLANLVDHATRTVIDRGYVSGNTATTLERKIGLKFGFEGVTDDRSKNKRSRAEGSGIVPQALSFGMSSSGYIQRDDRKYEYRMGRRLGKRQKVMRDLMGHAQSVVERWQHNQPNAAANTPNALAGAFNLAYNSGTYSTLPAGGISFTGHRCPFYCFDLTSVYNNNSFSAAHVLPVVGYRLHTNTTGGVWFVPQVGRDKEDAANTYTWATERIGTNSVAGLDVSGDKAVIDSVKANLTFVGAKKLPCTVYVELWSFYDKDLAPYNICSNVGETTYANEFVASDSENREAFWYARMKNQLGLNNQLLGDSDIHKGVRIKRLKTIKFQPTSTTESDPNGHMRNVELFIEMNKTVDLRWPGISADIIENELANPDKYAVHTGATNQRPYPEPEKGSWLVIRADVNQEALSDVSPEQVVDLYPTFDIILRRYRTQIKI